MKNIYNLDTVEAIIVNLKRKTTYSTYVPARTYLFGLIKCKPYIHLIVSTISVEEYLSNNPDVYLENETLYFKPYVNVRFVSGHQKEFSFETEKELRGFLEQFDFRKIAYT